jgi:hypothetical protein
MKLSGFTDIESMPQATKNSANCGWLLGASPHSPTLVPALRASRMTLSIVHAGRHDRGPFGAMRNNI